MPAVLSKFSYFQPEVERPLTFVKEFCTFAHNFEESSVDVAALEVGTCHLLEITNKNEYGERTYFSLTHFLQNQLDDETDTLKNSIAVIFNYFEAIGGDLKTAQFTVYGGTEEESIREFQRENLMKALGQIKPGIKIIAPDNHWKANSDDLTDYIFSSTSESWRKSDMKYEDGFHDIYSSNHTTQGEKKAFDKRVLDNHSPVFEQLDEQVNQRCNDINVGNKTLLVEAVGNDGLFIETKGAAMPLGTLVSCNG
ncbi:MAG: hypothetical protein QNK11_07145 [Legionella sp.]|nr:hypothetical protein [Legionella sp.]